MNKILFFIEALENSAGTERITVDLLNSLHRDGMDVGVLVLSETADSFFPLDEGISVYALKSPFASRIKTILRLRKFLKHNRPEFLINVGIAIGQVSFAATIGLGIKVVGWEHFNLFAGSKLGFYWRLLSAKMAYKTVVLTEQDRKDYLSYVHANVINISNFVSRFADVRAPLDSNVVLTVGRLAAQKGYDLLLEAWAEVMSRRSDWKLQIVGSGADEDALKAQSQRLGLSGTVCFIPATNQVEQYFRSASIYVMSSRFEGMPMVLVEAKMCGLPCVSFDCPNGPSEVICDGVDGIVVPQEDVKALANGLLELMADREKLQVFGLRAKEDAKRRFTYRAAVKAWRETLV